MFVRNITSTMFLSALCLFYAHSVSATDLDDDLALAQLYGYNPLIYYVEDAIAEQADLSPTDHDEIWVVIVDGASLIVGVVFYEQDSGALIDEALGDAGMPLGIFLETYNFGVQDECAYNITCMNSVSSTADGI